MTMTCVARIPFFLEALEGTTSHAFLSERTNMADDGESLESWLSKYKVRVFFHGLCLCYRCARMRFISVSIQMISETWML